MSLSVIDDRVDDRIGPRQMAYDMARKKQRLLPMWWVEDDGKCACNSAEECLEPGGHIIDELVPNGARGATHRWLVIDDWFRTYPRCSVAVLTKNGPAQILRAKDIGLARKNIPESKIPNSEIMESSRVVDLAREFISIMAPNDTLIRSIGMELYTYSSRLGIWLHLTESDVRSSIQEEFHGKKYRKDNGEDVGYLDMNPTKRDAVHNALMHERSIKDDKFFENAPRGIAFTNGWVDASDLLLKPHSPHQKNRARVDFPYSHDAKSDRFELFLNELFSNDKDAQQKIDVIQEFYGAAIFGKCPSFQKSLMLYGPQAGNGKSTLVSVMTRCLFPEGSAGCVSPREWGITHVAKTLDGVLVNHTGELGLNCFRDSEIFKTMVTGEKIQVCAKYEDPYYMYPTAGHVFETNVLPKVSELSNGFWRRIIFIPFNNTFKNRNFDSFVSAIAKEKVGIMRWAIEGAKRLFERGYYIMPPSHDEYMEVWKEEVDSVYAFLKLVCREDKSGHGTERGSLYKIYKEYCDGYHDTGEAVRRNDFYKRLALIQPKTRSKNNYIIYPYTVLPRDRWAT